jgi:hypothetical protein
LSSYKKIVQKYNIDYNYFNINIKEKIKKLINYKPSIIDINYISINENLLRIYNMLGSHGYIICSVRGLLLLQKCILEAYYENIPWDIYMAHMQPHYNAYGLKIPLVYQYGALGGMENETYIKYTEQENNSDDIYINKTNVSIITNYK